MKPISFEKKDIGGLLKISKQHYKWRFELEGRKVIIEVLSSKLSGRKRVFKDGFLIHEEQAFQGVYVHTFAIGEHSLTVLQSGEQFELRVDNLSFLHVLAQEKVRRAFVYEGDVQAKQPEPLQTMKAFDFGNNSGASNGNNFGGNQQQNFGQSSDANRIQGFGSGPQTQQPASFQNQQNPAPRCPVQLNSDDPWAEVQRARQEVLQQSNAQPEEPIPFNQPVTYQRPAANQSQSNQSNQFQAYPRAQVSVNQFNTTLEPIKQTKYQFGGFQRQQTGGQQNQRKYDDTYEYQEQSQKQKQEATTKALVSIPLNDLLKMPEQRHQPQAVQQQSDVGFSFDFGTSNQTPAAVEVNPAAVFDFGSQQPQATLIDSPKTDLLDIGGSQVDKNEQKLQDFINKLQTEATQPSAYPELDGINLQSQLDDMDDLDMPLQQKAPASDDILQLNMPSQKPMDLFDKAPSELDLFGSPKLVIAPIQAGQEDLFSVPTPPQRTDLIADLDPKVTTPVQQNESAGFSFDFGGSSQSVAQSQQPALVQTQFQFEF